MAQQIINTGIADAGNGDPLRTAFTKVNANFTELYTALGLNDPNLNLGAFEFNGSVMSTTDSTAITIDQATTVTSNLTVGGDILPSIANGGTLGSPTRPWRELYVSNSTIYFNNVPIALDEVGNLTVDGVPVNAVGSADWSAITNKPTFSDAATSGAWEDITGKPSILTGDDVIGFITSDTITEETPGGTVSQTTSYQNQIIVDTTDAIRIANVISQTVNDGVVTTTDSTGSTIDVDGTGAYIKRYVEPDGPNNSSYFQFSATNSGAIIEGVNEDLAGNTYGRVTVTQGVVVINTAAGGIDKEWVFDSDGNLTVPSDGTVTGTNDLYIKSLVDGNSSGVFLNGDPLVGTAMLYANGVSTIRADNNGTPKDWTFGKNATLTTPLLLPKAFTAVLDTEHFYPQPGIGLDSAPWEYQFEFQVNPDGSVQTTANDPVFFTNPGYVIGHAFRFTEADHGIPGYTFDVTIADIGLEAGGYYTQIAVSPPPEYPSTVASSGAIKLTANDKSFVFGTNGDLTLPQGGDILDSNGNSVLGGVGGLTISDGQGTSVENVTEILINGNNFVEVGPGVVGLTNLGGEAGPVQPYLELTNEPLIVQPVTLGTPVTVTVPNSGVNGRIDFIITEGPTIDINDITISAPGTGYVVGQRYKMWYYDIGGSNTDSNIEFTVGSVGELGELLAVTDFAFAGGLADNGAGTYLNRSFELQAWIFDEIGTGLTLARDGNQGLYNSDQESEYDNNTYLSPLGTEWNSDGWGDLTEIGLRTYTTWRQSLNNAVGNNIVASELVMHDTVNDKYYKFDFHTWGGSNGGYSYTRTEVTDPNYFRKPHNAENDSVDIIEDDSTLQIGITRTDSTGIYNPFTEEGFSNATSPLGTTWNADGWDDLSDIATRTYTSFDTAANGYNSVLGKKFVMYVASIQKYYAIQFYEWATNGDNNFSYVRYEIDQTKLNEGITFADGTKLKSAEGVGRVKSIAPGNRRIEEVVDYNEVSVTARTTNDYTGASARTTDTNYEIFVKRTLALDAVITPLTLNGNFTVEISFDGVTYLPSWLSSVQETEYWFYYENGNTYVPQTEDNPVYLRFTSGADPQIWWNKADLPGGAQDFRGAVIDYHAYTGESTIIGTIHIVDDSGEEHISHQEVQSGSTDGENDDLWFVQNEGTVSYRRTDGESKTLKIHWTAKVFYGSEFWD